MKKIEFKPLITTIALIVFQTICFFFSKLLQGTPHLIGNAIDAKIPFNIWFIIPYFIWYLLIFIVPYFLYKKNKDSFMRYIFTYVIVTIIANIIFIIYPSTVDRPEVVVKGLLTLTAKIIFAIDTPVLNCFPSLHCAMSMMFILFMFENKNINYPIKIVISLISVLIMAATLFVKQHVFIDLVSGDTLALVVYVLVKIFYKENNKFKKVLKI